jgi:hypothetical protein
MKHLSVLSVFTAAVSAASLNQQVTKISYDGYKVIRLAVGEEVDKVNGIVSNLGLKTWKGAPRAGAYADIVVPPSQFKAFSAATSGMEAITMHQDLGASIAEESSFHTYAGMFGLIASRILRPD